MWVGITLLIFHKEILAVLSSDDYGDSAKVLGPLVFAHIFWVFCSLLDSAYYVKRRTDLKPWLGLAATVVMLGCYSLLIPKYAAMGAAFATLIGFAIYAVINLVVARKVLSVQFEFGRLAGLSIIAFLACVGSHPLELGVGSFAIKTLLWLAFPAAIWLLLVNDEERETARMGVAKLRHAIASRN
jgi:O-antigen/teichoic acid export membrane protein